MHRPARPVLLLLLVLATGSALSLASSRAGAEASSPTLLRYPYLQQVSQTSALIVWATDTGGPSEVQYGAAGPPASTAAASSDLFVEPPITGETSRSYYVHVAQLSGLQAGTTYSYTVLTQGVDLTAGDAVAFRTDRGPADSLSILVFGDSGVGSQTQLLLRDQMTGRNFDVALHTGDLAYPYGTYQEIDQYFFTAYRDLASRFPIFPVLGNHEYLTLEGQPFLDVFHLPENALPQQRRERYYSFDYGPAHFVALDSEVFIGYPGAPTADEMLTWAAQDLDASQSSWKIVYLHKPPYSSTNVPVDVGLDQIASVLERHGVDIVFTGHDHVYARTLPIRDHSPQLIGAGGIPYVNTGGGGGGYHLCQPRSYTAVCLRQYHFLNVSIVDSCRLTYDAIGITSNVLDHFELNRCNPDSDNDGIPDSSDPTPLVADTDGDGLPDYMETGTLGTDPTNADSDGDGLSDGLEVNNWRTDPLRVDTDGDFYSDGVEAYLGSNPLDRNSVPVLPDADGDGITNEVDTSPGTFSNTFSDGPFAGITSGQILDRGGLTVRVNDQPAPGGVRISATGVGGPAQVAACTSPQVVSSLTPGDVGAITCGSATVAVASGPVVTWFGSLIANLPAGSKVRVTEPSAGVYNLTNDAGSSGSVAIGGVTLAPGASSTGQVDTDTDGLADSAESTMGTNPNGSDSDGDGLNDGLEFAFYGTSPLLVDSDGDGCRESQELGPNPAQGGQRDPANPWDYFNPTQDGTNRSDDITAAVAHYGHDQGVFKDYDMKYDRTALMGGHPWQFGPPDGVIRSFDITAAVISYGHDCA